MSAFLKIHFQILLTHFGVALFSGSMIGWAEGLNKGLLFGVLYFIFMFIVHFTSTGIGTVKTHLNKLQQCKAS